MSIAYFLTKKISRWEERVIIHQKYLLLVLDWCYLWSIMHKIVSYPTHYNHVNVTIFTFCISNMVEEYCTKASPLPISKDTISNSVSRAIIIGVIATDPEQYSNDTLQRLLNTCKSRGYRQSKIDDEKTCWWPQSSQMYSSLQSNVLFFFFFFLL